MADLTVNISASLSVDRLQRLLADLTGALDHLPPVGQPDPADAGDSKLVRELMTMIDNQKKTICELDEQVRRLREGRATARPGSEAA